MSNVKTSERVQTEGQKRGVEVLRAEAKTPQEIHNAFFMMRRQNADALIVFNDGFSSNKKPRLQS
jgi:hypothetical protein